MRQKYQRVMRLYACAAMSLCAHTATGWASDTTPLLSLKELVNQKVTSVSKQSENASQAAASVFVISKEDIRRSGVTTVAEVLRMVPGIEVARSGSSHWAITARGFNAQFSNKLLVLIDGRSVYTPLFSGVYWDEHNPDLGSIERIEVIRGPGATMWGANAVNGVINIITKNAANVQGAELETQLGNAEHSAVMRYGSTINENWKMRGYIRRHDQDGMRGSDDSAAGDKWHMQQFDHKIQGKAGDTNLTFQTTYQEGLERELYALPTPTSPFVNRVNSESTVRSGSVQATAEHRVNKDTWVQLSSYVDHEYRNREYIGEHEVDTLDAEVQLHHKPSERHDVVVGSGYRLVQDDLKGSFYLSFQPEKRQTQLVNAFVQDKIALVPQSLFLTLGSKIESNDYTGFEVQPNARLSWLVNENHTLWTAVSRAVRVPNRAIDDVSLVLGGIPGGGGVLRQIGDRSVESEHLTAYEIGYRGRPLEDFAYDISVFYNDYEHIYINRMGAPTLENSADFGTSVMVPWDAFNTGTGSSYGTDISLNYNVSDDWRLAFGYAFLKVDLSQYSTIVSREGTSPEQQFSLRSYYNITQQLQWDNFLYYVDALPAEGVDAYVRLDTRIGWRPNSVVEYSITGQNLLDPTHEEFSPFLYNTRTEVGRSVIGRITWNF